MADSDAAFLKKEMDKMMKSHSKIIKRVTSRTKVQLDKLVPVYPSVLTDIVSLSGYGNFLKCCILPPEKVTAVLLNTACSGLGCDINAIIRTLCTCNRNEFEEISKEFMAMRKPYHIENREGSTLSEVVLKLLQKNEQIHDIFSKIFSGAEADSVATVDATDVSAKVFPMLKRKNDEDFAAICDLLCPNSRSDNAAIAAAYKAQFNDDLVMSLQTRFVGPVGYALALWCSSVPDSVAKMLSTYGATKTPSIEFIYGILGKYDKGVIAEIDSAYSAFNLKGSLTTLSKTVFKGKLREAVNGWISNASPDNGSEHALSKYLSDDRLTKEEHLKHLIKEEKSCLQVRTLVESVAKNLTFGTRGEWKPIPLTGTFEAPKEEVEASSEADKEAGAKYEKYAWDEDEVEVPDPVHAPDENEEPAAATSTISANKKLQVNNETDVPLISSYLLLLFEEYDRDQSGQLETDEFWKLIKTLDMAAYGFTEDEIGIMQELCDWDADGGIAYEEIVGELAFSMLSCAQSNNIDPNELTRARIKEFYARPGESTGILASAPVEETSAVPPNLVDYLRATFESFDVDKSGALNVNEMMQMVQAMNLGITDADVEALRVGEALVVLMSVRIDSLMLYVCMLFVLSVGFVGRKPRR